MNGKMSIWRALCLAMPLFASAPAAHGVERATAVDTFISGLGNDSNASANCPRTNPCRTLATAYTVTQSSGDIIALDPADYGPLTITGPVSILGVEGAVIAVVAGTTGITINVPAGDKIAIKDISISGAGATDATGIAITGGLLVLRNSTLKLLTTGLSVTDAHADVIDTDFIGNTTAMITHGAGEDTSGNPPFPTAQTLVRMSGGSYINNTSVFVMQNAAQQTGGQCENTFWGYSVSSANPSMNVAGYTHYLSSSPPGPPYNCNVGYYYGTSPAAGSSAPN
jgi:hypothetical protein